MQNLEIKSPVHDPKALRTAIEALPAEFSGILHQTDTYFNVPNGRLKLRVIAGQGAELIAYNRPDGSGERVSDFDIFRFPEPDAPGLLQALTRSVGVRAVVEKRRELFMFRGTRIHLDTVADLGTFMELEIPYSDEQAQEAQKTLEFLKSALGLNTSEFINGSYIDLILPKSNG